MKPVIKRSAEQLLVRSGIAAARRAALRSDAIVLAYHNIMPDDVAPRGEQSLHLTRRAFAGQLESLLRTHRVVPLAELLEPAGGRKPRVAITFDDAYQGTLTVGIAELAQRGLPATIFVSPGFVNGLSFWWDALSLHETLPDEMRAELLGTFGGRDLAIREWAWRQRRPLQEPPDCQRCCTEADLVTVSQIAGITFGSHTWSHPNLTVLGQPELEAELTRPLDWLRNRFDNVIPWLAYPYGLTSPEVERAAQRAGYVAALRVDGGWLHSVELPARIYALPRLNIPAGLSREGFTLRLAGMFAA